MFGEVESKLIVYLKVIETRSFQGFTNIVVLSITSVTVITSYPFCVTIAASSLTIACVTMLIAHTRFAESAINWFSKEFLHTVLAMGSPSIVGTRLDALTVILTSAVAVTIA